MKIINPTFFKYGNFGCAAAGLVIGGKFLINLSVATNPVAKYCYGLSVLCGGSSMIMGSVSAVGGACQINTIAMGGDCFGGAFLWLGNSAHKMGNLIQEKKNPFSLRNWTRHPMTRKGLGYKGTGFVAGGYNIEFDSINIFQNIPYTQIFIIGSTVFTVYRSTKLIIKGYGSIYRYAKQKLTSKLNSKHAVLFASEYLIESFYIDRMYKIYSVALQL